MQRPEDDVLSGGFGDIAGNSIDAGKTRLQGVEDVPVRIADDAPGRAVSCALQSAQQDPRDPAAPDETDRV